VDVEPEAVDVEPVVLLPEVLEELVASVEALLVTLTVLDDEDEDAAPPPGPRGTPSNGVAPRELGPCQEGCKCLLESSFGVSLL